MCIVIDMKYVQSNIINNVNDTWDKVNIILPPLCKVDAFILKLSYDYLCDNNKYLFSIRILLH